MTSRKDDDQDADRALERDLVRALREGGELVPTTSEEVRAAERELEEDPLELPPSLREYRGRRPERPVAIVRRLPFVGYAAAGLLGAAATALLFLAFGGERAHDLTGAGRDLRPDPTRVGSGPSAEPSARAPKKPAVLAGIPCAGDCCGGPACKQPRSGFEQCPSGARCIACSTTPDADGPYRLRVGTMILAPAGERLLRSTPAASGPPGADLELCVVTPGTSPACLPALSNGGSGESWRQLSRVSTSQDLLSGLKIELRRQGQEAALATWTSPVAASPEIQCRGLAIQFKSGDELFGRLSAFVEQTHFVELGRAPTLSELAAIRSQFEFREIEPRVYETTQPGQRFALVLGPLDKSAAQSLRWSVLESGREASVSFGLDFSGAPRPTP